MHHFLSSLISFSAPTNHSLSFLVFLSCYISSSHISLLFLTCPTHTSLSFFSCSSSHTSLCTLSTHLTSLPLSSYFHISVPFLDKLYFSLFFDFPSLTSHSLFFIPLISLPSFFLSSLPITTHLFPLPVLHIPYLLSSFHTSQSYLFFPLVSCSPLVSHPFPSSFLSFPHLIPYLLFTSFLYFIFIPFPSTHLTFFSSIVLFSSHHFLFCALLVSLPPSLPCLPHGLLPLIVFLPLTTHLFSFTCLYLVHLFLFLFLNDFLPVAFTFLFFSIFYTTSISVVPSCFTSLPFTSVPALTSHFLFSFSCLPLIFHFHSFHVLTYLPL